MRPGKAIGTSLSQKRVLDCLVDTIWLISTIQDEESLTGAHRIRNQMETILMGQIIDEFEGLDSYIEKVRKADADLAEKVYGMFPMRKPVEDRLINAGNRLSNIYLIELDKGFLLIDAGYRKQFRYFEKALKEVCPYRHCICAYYPCS